MKDTSVQRAEAVVPIPPSNVPNCCKRQVRVLSARHALQLEGVYHSYSTFFATSLWSRNVPKSGEIHPTFQRAFSKAAFACSSPPTPASPVSAGHVRSTEIHATFPQISRTMASLLRGPRIIGAVGNRRHPWGEQHRIEPRTKRNHSWANLGYLTSGDHFSRSP